MNRITRICIATPMLAAAFVATVALARTQPAGMGRPYNAADTACFANTSVPYGIVNVCSTSRFWDMPVVWDNPTGFAKTVTVRAKVNTAGSLSCTYEGWNADGTPVAGINFPPFGTGITASSITVPSVPVGAFGHVTCNVGAAPSVVLRNLDYVTP